MCVCVGVFHPFDKEEMPSNHPESSALEGTGLKRTFAERAQDSSRRIAHASCHSRHHELPGQHSRSDIRTRTTTRPNASQHVKHAAGNKQAQEASLPPIRVWHKHQRQHPVPAARDSQPGEIKA